MDKKMACVIADNIGVRQPQGTNVTENKSSPALSQLNTPYYAYTQKVGVLIGNGFNGEEVCSVLRMLKECGVFMEIISERLGWVVSADGLKIEVEGF